MHCVHRLCPVANAGCETASIGRSENERTVSPHLLKHCSLAGGRGPAITHHHCCDSDHARKPASAWMKCRHGDTARRREGRACTAQAAHAGCCEQGGVALVPKPRSGPTPGSGRGTGWLAGEVILALCFLSHPHLSSLLSQLLCGFCGSKQTLLTLTSFYTEKHH